MRQILIGAAVVSMLAACQEQQEVYTNISGFTQGSVFSITYADSLNRNFAGSFDSIFSFVDGSMSVFNDSSIISRINRNEHVPINSAISEVLCISGEVSQMTGGAFDITIGPVSRAIGFAGGNGKGIDTVLVNKMLENVGMDKVWVEGDLLVKSNSQVAVDLNAIAQGYTSDLVARFLNSKGVDNYIVEVGGEIVAHGTNKRGTPWVVGIDRPIEGGIPGENIQARFYLTGGRGLATSGNYRKFVEVDGQKYSHTIDPHTGLPVLNSLLSATVFANNASIADALGTAFMVHGLDWSINFVNSNPDVDAYLIYSDSIDGYKVWKSDGLEEVK